MKITRLPYLGVIFVLFGVVAVFSLSTVSQRSVAAESSESKLHQLLSEKVSILKEDVDHLEDLHSLGQAGFEELFAAHMALYRARLDLCETDKDRIDVLEKLLGEAKRREEAVASLGNVSSSLLKHRAQVDRIDIEIMLERLKAK